MSPGEEQPLLRISNRVGFCIILLFAGCSTLSQRGVVNPESAQRSCVDNLRMLDAAKEMASFDFEWPRGLLIGPAAERRLVHFLPGEKLPRCPGGGHYTVNAIGANPTCSMNGHYLSPPR